ncbi:MAG: hypothetical protein C3F06_02120 [Candidatus Methanoperedenaceae archaeon]|nr:MAG: hypothetical protein C3F06_02120 [Candidatus Methanoperedenaceae archaeon]
MKYVYILIVLVVAALASGCVDKKQTETSTQVQTSPGEAAVTAAVTSPVAAPDDLFGTESDLNAMNSTLGDMDMQISLVDTI